MSHRYDASTKYLVQTRLADWLPLCGRTTSAEIQIIDADLATVTAAADRVLRICEDPPWLAHLELQSSRDPDLVPNLPVYNVVLERRHRALVRTFVVLLRRPADSPELTGALQRGFPGEPPYLVFRYGVVRVWQLPAETFLSGGMGILPLAPLGAVAEAELPDVIRRMEQRISAEATPDEAGTLWTATDVLMGLRYPRTLVSELLRGVHGMKDSVTYQAIVEEGEVKALHRALLHLGRKRFGPPNPASEMAVHGIEDPDRLERLIDALLEVSSWEELLATR
jgi:hypothetical protein